jgi:hypothetical protein
MSSPQLTRIQSDLAQGATPDPAELRGLLGDPANIEALGEALDLRQQQIQSEREAFTAAAAGSGEADPSAARRIAGRQFMEDFLKSAASG